MHESNQPANRRIGYSRFLGRKTKTDIATIHAVDALRAAPTPNRIFAEVIAPRIEAAIRGRFIPLRPPFCLHRLLTGRCPTGGERDSEGIPCSLPGFDHNSLWKRKSDGARLLITQPYRIDSKHWRSVFEFADAHDLHYCIHSLSFHFPSFTLLVEFMRNADWHAGATSEIQRLAASASEMNGKESGRNRSDLAR